MGPHLINADLFPSKFFADNITLGLQWISKIILLSLRALAYKFRWRKNLSTHNIVLWYTCSNLWSTNLSCALQAWLKRVSWHFLCRLGLSIYTLVYCVNRWSLIMTLKLIIFLWTYYVPFWYQSQHRKNSILSRSV